MWTRYPAWSWAIRLPAKKSAISVCSAVRVVLVADPTAATSRTPQKGTSCYRRVRDLVVNQTMLTATRGRGRALVACNVRLRADPHLALTRPAPGSQEQAACGSSSW